MIYIIISIAAILIIFFIYKFIKSGSKEVGTKLSYKDRAKLERSLEGDSSSEKETELVIDDTPNNFTAVENKTEYKPIQKPFPKKYQDEILKYEPEPDENHDEYTLAFRKAIRNVKIKNFGNALSDLTKAIECKTYNAEAFYCRGLVKCKLNNYESSILDFTEAIRLQMDESNALYFRGLAKYETKDHHGAILDFESFNKDITGYANAYNYLGLCYSQLNQYEDAILNFSEAITINPLHSDAFFGRALAKDKTGDKNGCCTDLKSALNHGHLEAYHFLKQLCPGGNPKAD